jgi:hypothetical protein
MQDAQSNGDMAPEGVEGRFEFSIQVGMLEVYNDNVFDILLKQKKKVASDK